MAKHSKVQGEASTYSAHGGKTSDKYTGKHRQEDKGTGYTAATNGKGKHSK